MESFYGCLEPRQAPNPTSFIENIHNPLIPDVSLMFNKSTYNDKENFFTAKPNYEKQVQFFQPPKNIQPSTINRLCNSNISNIESNVKPSNPILPKLNSKLELSLFDNRNQTPEKNPKSYRDWLVFNAEQKEKAQEVKKVEPEPTISDLYQIVRTQNDHLKNLQKQVEILLDQNETLKHKNRVESPPKCKCVDKAPVKDAEANTSTNPVQVSIGVMTSFEINVGPNRTETKTDQRIRNAPEKHFEVEKRQFQLQNKNYGNFNSHLTNTMTDGCSRYKEYSLSEIPEIPEPLEDTMYSEKSIHVDMQEFPESSDEESEESSGKESNEANRIGWTVYNNVVEQVQNILEQFPRENKSIDDNLNESENYMPAVSPRIPNLINDQNMFQKQCISSNDLSVEVNQLVMKYLRDDQLSFLVSKNQRIQSSPSSRKKPFQKQNIGFASPPNGNEMSFATIKYMQKYRLWNQSNDRIACNVQHMIKTQECRPSNKYSSQSKILDITALKQQPKLL